MSQDEGIRPPGDEVGLTDPRAPWEELIEDPNAPRRLLAVLFTDIIGSTELATALGDQRWRELLEQHDAAIRTQIARFGGTEVDTAGDAFFATFELPVRAVDCALESARAVRRLGLRIRAGVHMGECVVSNGKVRGVSVHIGARVGAKARGDEVLVSSTVRDILAGAGLKFVDRGEQTLKGVSGRWRLYAVEPRERDNEADLPPLLEAEIAAPPVPWWKQRRNMVAGLTALALLAGAITFVTLRGPGGLATVPADSVAVIDPSSGATEFAVSVGRRPVGLTAAPDGVWVANSIDRTVSRVGKDGKTVDTIGPVGSAPTALAAGNNLIWVANSDGHSVSRVSGQTRGIVGSAVGTGNGLSSVAFGAGALWITNSVDGTVWRIDPQTGDMTNKVLVGQALRDVVATNDAVWAVSEAAGTLARSDPKTGAVTRVIKVGNGARAIAVGAGAVWVANAFDGTVSRVERDGARVTATIRVGRGPRGIAVVGGLVAVANETEGTVSVIDPKSNRVVRTVRLGNAPMDVVASGGRLFVSVRGGTLHYRGGTFRFGSTYDLGNPDARSFDPHFGWNQFNFPITTAVYDGLLTYKRVGGVEGAEVVPDLAEEILPPTDGGTTYTFRLRAGLRYSNGQAVKASDVRRSFERQFLADAEGLVFWGVVKGASACNEKTCDLSAGILTDDQARTVTFHLVRATPDFLHLLAHPLAVIVPPDTPATNQRFTPIVGTGPYRIGSIEPHGDTGEVTLVRNPRFVARPPAQPDGYPDRFVIDWGKAPRSYVEATRTGAEDATIDLLRSHVDVDQLVATNPSQVHLFDEQTVLFMTLNQNTPPFNDVRVRRAVNFAVDRRAMAQAIGAPFLADTTCQVLAKNVFGYTPYCPYTKNPNPAGIWTAPDLETARRLVAESGTKGMRITVSTHANYLALAAGPQWVKALNALGYQAQLKILDADELYGHAREPKRYQSILDGWFADYPSASNFFVPLIACEATSDRLTGTGDSSGNLAKFCSPAIDRLIEDALQKQQSDLLDSARVWASVDRAVTDAAPWVAYATRRNSLIVSPRVGNVEWNPALGLLLTQMWLTDRR